MKNIMEGWLKANSLFLFGRGVRRVVVHKGYKPDFRDLSIDRLINDIALVKFDKPLDPDPGFGIMPICLPSSSRFKDEEKEGQFFFKSHQHMVTINACQLLLWVLA